MGNIGWVNNDKVGKPQVQAGLKAFIRGILFFLTEHFI